MIRRSLCAFASVLLLLLGVTACGSGAINAKKVTQQGVSKDEIALGTVLPLTGGAALAGQGIQAGLQAAIGEVNAAGGVNGRKISLKVLDDNFDAATHVADFKRLVSQTKVYAILVPAGSANIPGDWPIAKSSGIPVFGPYLPSDPGLPSVFSLGTDHPHQTMVLANYLAQQGAKKVAFIGQQNDLGVGMHDGLEEVAPKLGLTVGDPQWVQPNSTSVSSAVLNAKAQKPDAVILGTDGTQTSLVLKQAAKLHWAPVFAGDSSTASTNSTVVTDAAGAAANGLLGSYIAADPNSDDPAVKSFGAAVTKYADKGDTFVTNSFALQSYAFAKVFFHILDGMGDSLSWSDFIKAAESLQGYEVGLLPTVSFGPLPGGHVGTTGAKVAQFEKGKWVSKTPDWVQVK